MITKEDLDGLMSYDYLTGEFIWKKTNNKRRDRWAGKKAGTTDTRYFYKYVNILGKRYFIHRLVWLHCYGEHPKSFIDHINCNKTDNRISNLREVSKSQNAMNTNISKTNTSGFKGVSWNKRLSKWQAHIRLHGRSVYLGMYLTKEEASLIYNKVCQEHHGEFYRDTTK